MRRTLRGASCAVVTRALVVLALALDGACSEGAPPEDVAPSGGPAPVPVDAATPPNVVRAVFDLGPDPMPFGAIPWPDDLYLDAMQRVSVRDLPGPETARSYRNALEAAFADLDGFGVSPTAYFRFDGELDPKSLPGTPDASVGEEASVFLLDVDPSSSEVFQRIPVVVEYQAANQRIALRPAYSRALTPGRLYAAVVTRDVRDEDGERVEGGERFVALRDPAVMLLDPLEIEARGHFTPVLETLASEGVARENVAALAVFRVQSAGNDLADARALIRSADAPAPTLTSFVSGTALDEVLGMAEMGKLGLDGPTGAPHTNVGAMIHGSVSAPNLLSGAARTHGQFMRREGHQLKVFRQSDVYFTLWLPRGAATGELPLVVIQHGLGGDRSDALALANALLGMGYAVIAVDAPFHGLRSGRGDTTNRFTNRNTPDGFGDLPGDFEGVDDREGELEPFHPFYFRDAVRQGVVDLMTVLYSVEAGDWSSLAEGSNMPLDVTIDATQVLFVGVDLGGEMGVMLTPHEPSIGAAVFAFAGGLSLDGWLDSPARTGIRDALFGRIGRADESLDAVADKPSPWPELEAFKTLIARGTGLAHARQARRTRKNFLLLMAHDDEVVNNRQTEALAFALGAWSSAAGARFVPDLPLTSLPLGERLSGNFAVEDVEVTRVLFELMPATHTTLSLARGMFDYVHPVEPPFVKLADSESLINPIGDAFEMISFFFESWRACKAQNPEGPCPASVMSFTP